MIIFFYTYYEKLSIIMILCNLASAYSLGSIFFDKLLNMTSLCLGWSNYTFLQGI